MQYICLTFLLKNMTEFFEKVSTRTENYEKKKERIYLAYKDLLKELGKRARYCSKQSLYAEVGEIFNLSGYRTGEIIKKKIKSERTIIS